ncbi:hemicentin-1-like [Tropilaelaps mercedesae]|uniref:Hemicentin-1-like n=1 Tax=Tropilaelaps mercedesae TaxID=418985 RepID=A0A1V9XTG8_9ACAR|nr:hemicentin-1-like [Tropilaelaps mercedesae]
MAYYGSPSSIENISSSCLTEFPLHSADGPDPSVLHRASQRKANPYHQRDSEGTTMALVFFLMSVSFPAFLRILASSDLYFGGKSVLRCAALEEVTQPRQVEWYHEDDLIYVATIQV